MWAKVDDGWWKHRKVMALSWPARGLWVTCLSYCGDQSTPHVPAALLAMLRVDDGWASELVDAGLWDKHQDGDGYVFHDWDDYQSLTLSQQRSAAGKVGGLTRALRDAEDRVAELEAQMASNSPNGKPEASTVQANGKQTASTVQADGSDTPKHGPEPEPEPEVSRTDVVAQAPPAEPSCSHRLDPQGQHTTPDIMCKACTAFLEHWWPVYPERGGRKRGKGRALKEWLKLSHDQQQRAYKGARNLALEDTLPKDPHRFLRRDTAGQFPFDDHQEPPRTAAGPSPPSQRPAFVADDYCDCGQRLDHHEDDLCVTETHDG